MKNTHANRTRSIVLLLFLTVGLALPVGAVSDRTLAEAVAGSSDYLLRSTPTPQAGSSIGGEWTILALARGQRLEASYEEAYRQRLEAYVKDCQGVLHERKYSEYARVSLALTAIGEDPNSFAGYNLLQPLGDFDKTVFQGLSGPIWALLALDAGAYAMPQNPKATHQATRELYRQEILSRQLEDGGWSLTGKGSADPDITAMALQALSNDQTQDAVHQATDKALIRLSAMQDADGGYASWGAENSESTAQVIIALCALGLDPEDSRFVKNGTTLLDDLLRYRQSDGSFLHTGKGEGSNQMASEQGLCALVAVQRARAGSSSLYRMKAAAPLPPITEKATQSAPISLPKAHAAEIRAASGLAALEALTRYAPPTTFVPPLIRQLLGGAALSAS